MNEMRKLMESIERIEEDDNMPSVVEVDLSHLDFDNKEQMQREYYDKFNSTDWRQGSEEVFEAIARELAQFGLKVYMADMKDDEYHWYIGK